MHGMLLAVCPRKPAHQKECNQHSDVARSHACTSSCKQGWLNHNRCNRDWWLLLEWEWSNFTDIPRGRVQEKAKQSATLPREFLGSLTDFPKPLIAVVNGPAVGLSVTVLELWDAIYASNRATFHIPFSHPGWSPEGCAPYTFLKIMGLAKATEMLILEGS